MHQYHDQRPSLTEVITATGIDVSRWMMEQVQNGKVLMQLMDDEATKPAKNDACIEMSKALAEYGFDASAMSPAEPHDPWVQIAPYKFPYEKIMNGEAYNDGTIVAAGPLVTGKLFSDIPYRIVLRAEGQTEHGRVTKYVIHTQAIPPGVGKHRKCHYMYGSYFPMPEDPKEFDTEFVKVMEKFNARVMERLRP